MLNLFEICSIPQKWSRIPPSSWALSIATFMLLFLHLLHFLHLYLWNLGPSTSNRMSSSLHNHMVISFLSFLCGSLSHSLSTWRMGLLTVFRWDRTLLGVSIPNFDETFGDGFWHGKNDKEAFQIYF